MRAGIGLLDAGAPTSTAWCVPAMGPQAEPQRSYASEINDYLIIMFANSVGECCGATAFLLYGRC